MHPEKLVRSLVAFTIARASLKAELPASRTWSSSSMHRVEVRTTYKVPLARTLEPKDICSPIRGLRHLLKCGIAREEDQIFAETPRRAFFPHEAQETIVAVREHDRAFGRVGVNKVGLGASERTSGFEGEEGLAVGEGDRHGRGELVDDEQDAYVRRGFK